MTRHPPRVVVVVATIACVLLALELRPRAGVSPATSARGLEAVPIPGAAGQVPIARLGATVLARPLFSPDRRPVARVATAGAPTPLPRLTGTIVAADGERVAILVDDTATSAALREGARWRAFQVMRIASGQVVVVRGGERITLALRRGTPMGASAPMSFAPAARAFEMTKDPRSRAADNQDE